MSRRSAVILGVLSVACAACGTSKEAAKRVAMPTHGALRSAARGLTPTPDVVKTACKRARASVDFTILCPTHWPRTRSPSSPSLRWMTKTKRVYLLNAFNGLRDRSPHVFHLLIGGQQRDFGKRWTAIDPGLRVTTGLVTTPIRGGGRFVQQRPARRIGTTTVAGHAAVVLQEPAYPQGGLQGGHIIILWNAAGHGYLVSVHGLSLSIPALIQLGTAVASSAAKPN